MASAFLQGLSTRRNINKPTVTCAATQGVLNVYVHGVRAPGMPAPALALVGGSDQPIGNVSMTVTGPANANGTTNSKGRKGFGPYPVNSNCTVTLNVGTIPAKYDSANIQPGNQQVNGLNAGAATVFDFVVPWHWVVFTVTNSDNQPASKVPYKLRYLAPGTNAWTLLESGNLPANGMLVKDVVPAGRYKLSIPELSVPTWQHPDVQTGRGETLTVTASGLENGEQGDFQIVDAFDDSKIIHTIPSQISAAGGGQQMTITWTPTDPQLRTLTQSRIAFKARCQGANCLSDARTVYSTETLQVQTPAGAAINTQVTSYFSGGSNYQTNSINGQAMITTPWKEKIVRVQLNLNTPWRGKGTGEDQPDWHVTRP